MRPELRAVIDGVLRTIPAGGSLTIDELGERMGTVAFSTDEIDTAMTAIESSGRRVVGPEGGGTGAHLQTVMQAAHALRNETGRPPSVAALSERTGLDADVVRTALALGRVMGR